MDKQGATSLFQQDHGDSSFFHMEAALTTL